MAIGSMARRVFSVHAHNAIIELCEGAHIREGDR